MDMQPDSKDGINIEQIKSDRANGVIVSFCTIDDLIAAHEKSLAENAVLAESLRISNANVTSLAESVERLWAEKVAMIRSLNGMTGESISPDSILTKWNDERLLVVAP